MSIEMKREGVLIRPDEEPVKIEILDLGENDLKEKGSFSNHDKVEIIYTDKK
jgi:hypothetical protein